MTKKGSMKSAGLILLVFGALVVLGGNALGFWSFNGGSGGGGGGGDGGVACDPTVTPELTISLYDLENPGTAVTEVISYREVGKTVWNVVTSGTAITGYAPDTVLEYVIGVNGSDQYDNAYGPTGKVTVECKETQTLEIGVYNDEVEGSMAATDYNADDVADTAETVAANTEEEVFVKFKAGANEIFGNKFCYDQLGILPNVLVVKVNATDTDDIKNVWVKESAGFPEYLGMELNKIGCPTVVSAATGFTNYCFEAPPTDDKGIKFAYTAEADGSVAITTDFTVSYYAGGYYINAENSAVGCGIEDESGNAVGASDPDTNTQDMTA